MVLPPDTLVFVKTTNGHEHLYTLDVTTRTQTLVSRLDDSGRAFTPRISPDRRWIAFGALGFRANPSEVAKKVGALWEVSSDGKTFHRLTPETKLIDETLGCANNEGCLLGQVCQAGKCTWSSLSASFSRPVWAPDTKALYYQFVVTWNCAGLPVGRICLGTSVGTLRNGEVELARNGCDTGMPAFHAGSGRMVVTQSNCSNAERGIYEWTQEPFASKGLLLKDTAERQFLSSPAWLPDGSGLIFVFSGADYTDGIGRWTAASGDVKTLYMSTKDRDVSGLTVGPNGQIVYETLVRSGNVEQRDLHLLDAQTGTSTPLTTSGDSSDPGW